MCSLCLGGESLASLDAELKTPYKLKVVLHVAEHRSLTDLFKEQVERELRDHLALTFGDLAAASANDMLAFRNVGVKFIAEIDAAFKHLGVPWLKRNR